MSASSYDNQLSMFYFTMWILAFMAGWYSKPSLATRTEYRYIPRSFNEMRQTAEDPLGVIFDRQFNR